MTNRIVVNVEEEPQDVAALCALVEAGHDVVITHGDQQFKVVPISAEEATAVVSIEA